MHYNLLQITLSVLPGLQGQVKVRSNLGFVTETDGLFSSQYQINDSCTKVFEHYIFSLPYILLKQENVKEEYIQAEKCTFGEKVSRICSYTRRFRNKLSSGINVLLQSSSNKRLLPELTPNLQTMKRKLLKFYCPGAKSQNF